MNDKERRKTLRDGWRKLVHQNYDRFCPEEHVSLIDCIEDVIKDVNKVWPILDYKDLHMACSNADTLVIMTEHECDRTQAIKFRVAYRNIVRPYQIEKLTDYDKMNRIYEKTKKAVEVMKQQLDEHSRRQKDFEQAFKNIATNFQDKTELEVNKQQIAQIYVSKLKIDLAVACEITSFYKRILQNAKR